MSDRLPSDELPSTLGLGARTTADGRAMPVPDEVARGQHLGRFIVLRTLGIGGMGMVVSAYDPKLERTVALKVLRPDIAPSQGATEARARLLREAQAMAKLRHPNVVTVFEVGEFGEQVFLAMEYVPGTTLNEWAQRRRGEPRGWVRTVAAFVDAGRGLVAAHALGMIHRDFKPTNVLIDGERVQVTDFGIASVGGHDVVATPRLAAPAVPVDAAVGTGTGALVGTAPYMAPELLRGEPADAKSDQFAFCVALHESVYGQRPFVGHDLETWSRSITDGRVVAADDAHGVPEWIRQAILRGLAKDPAARWPSMAALVEALASPETSEIGRGVRVALGAATGAMFVALPLVAKLLGPPFDRSTYAGAIGQTLALIAAVVTMAWLSRGVIGATATNIKSFYGVVAVLAMQLPLELANAATGVSVAASDMQHLVLWAAMAAMFGVTLDRRFLALTASYLAFVPLAVIWPQHILSILGLSNAVLVGFLLVVWRAEPVREPA